MKKTALIFFLSISALFFNVSALEVDRDELAEGENGIEFVNYEGPHTVINTRLEIFGVGTYLGNVSVEKGTWYSYHDKYSVIHAVDPASNTLLDADIFVIHNSAGVDHIRNLRLMVSGYLEAQYGYSEGDAALLAEFITVYNAVFRGNSAYMAEKYKTIVNRYLEPTKIGLARIYNEWPGKTMMLIPLSEKAGEGTLASLSSDELTEDEVIEELREEEDMGLESRRDMVELKEREVDEARDELEEEREALDEEQEELEERQRELAERTPADLPEDERRAEEEEIERQLEELEERRDELAEDEEEQEERVARIQEEREGIADDTATVLREEGETGAGIREIIREEGDAGAIAGQTLILKVRDISGELMGSLLFVDSESGDVLQESSLNVIRQRWFGEVNRKVVVLAGREGRGGAVRLVRLNGQSLEVEVESSDEMHKDSVVVISGSDIYAVYSDNGSWKLGKYDLDLQRTAQSDFEVDPVTAVILREGKVFVQDRRGSIRIMEQRNLSAVN